MNKLKRKFKYRIANARNTYFKCKNGSAFKTCLRREFKNSSGSGNTKIKMKRYKKFIITINIIQLHYMYG